MKVKLTYVKNEQKTSKAGKPYTTCSIKTDKTGNDYINGFGNKQTAEWLEGDEVDVEIYEEEYNGKMYKKFKALGKIDMLELGMKQMSALLKKHEDRIASLENMAHPVQQNPIPEVVRKSMQPQEITVDSLPF